MAKTDGNNFETLYSNADKALYHTKNNGKNSYHFFGKEVNGNAEYDSTQEDLNYIRKLLREDDVNGSYLVEYEGFKNIARFIKRNVNRSGNDVVYILFTLDNDTQTLMSSEDIAIAMKQLEVTIREVLRTGDVTTRYSSRQMIVILMNADINDAKLVVERVKADFLNKLTVSDIVLREDIQYI